MPTDKVGDVSFDLVERPEYALALRESFNVYDRAGIDGHEVVTAGQRGPLFIWANCYKWSTSVADANGHLADVAALVGEKQTIYDTYGGGHENILVVSARPLEGVRAVIKDGETKYRTVCRLEMRRTE